MKAFIINLEEDVERRANAITQCRNNNIKYHIINAINGRLLSDMKLREITHHKYSNGLTPSEIGCALSHYNAYKKIVSDKLSYALIIEDDINLNNGINDILQHLEKMEYKEPTIILLSEIRKYINIGRVKINNIFSIVNVSQASLSHGYIINYEAAVKLLEVLFPIWLEADRWSYLREIGVVNLKAVIPPVANLSTYSEESTIWCSKYELALKGDIRKTRSLTLHKIRKNRSIVLKLKNIVWKLAIRKLFEKDWYKYD